MILGHFREPLHVGTVRLEEVPMEPKLKPGAHEGLDHRLAFQATIQEEDERLMRPLQ